MRLGRQTMERPEAETHPLWRQSPPGQSESVTATAPFWTVTVLW